MVRKQIQQQQQQQPSADEETANVTSSSVSNNNASNNDQPPFLTLEETTTADGMRRLDLGGLEKARHNKPPPPSTPTAEGYDGQDAALKFLNGDYKNDVADDDNDKERRLAARRGSKPASTSFCSIKKVIQYTMLALILLIVWDALFTPPERRWIQPNKTDLFLHWVQDHPVQGLFAFMVVIAGAVVVLIPIGTPLTLGCGYIYKGAYGWKLGLTVATLVSMGGSALGAVICFLLGRYLFRDQVRQWARNKYPLFDAIDTAASEHGLRIMAMLYLTPVLPLGPVSYMCGTTSMALSSFVIAKIASLPLMLLYCFIGASTRSLISSGNADGGNSDDMKSIEQNQTLIAAGIGLSFVMIAGITTYIRKELNRILERQGKHKPGEKESNPGGSDYLSDAEDVDNEQAIEMGHSRTKARRRAA